MKIHTATSVDVETGETISDSFYEYDGPIALAGGGPLPWHGGGTKFKATCTDSKDNVASLSGDDLMVVISGPTAQYFNAGATYDFSAHPVSAGDSVGADSESPETT